MAVFGGTRGVAQLFLRSAVKRGLTSAQAIREMMNAGLGYRRTAMLADYREWAQVPIKQYAIGNVRKDYRPSRALFIETSGKQLRPYRYQVGVDVYNPETRKTIHIVTNLSSERQLTIAEIEAEALEPIKRSTDAYKSEITSLKVEAAFFRKDMEWD